MVSRDSRADGYSQVIVATRKSYITGVTPEVARKLYQQNGPPNPVYRYNAECVVSAVILWPGMIASFARYVLFLLPVLLPGII